MANVRKRGCMMISIFATLGLWVILAAMIMLDEPDRATYAPRTAATPYHAIGSGWELAVPEGWSVSKSGRIFTGPGDLRLEVDTGHLAKMKMSPKTLGGKERHGRYTSVAYGQGLLKRRPDAAEVAETHFINFGETHQGVEAWLRDDDGEWLRCFAIVNRFRVLELRFHLPSGPESPAWKECAAIFETLRQITRKRSPPPAPPPTRPNIAHPADSGTTAATGSPASTENRALPRQDASPDRR